MERSRTPDEFFDRHRRLQIRERVEQQVVRCAIEVSDAECGVESATASLPG